MNEHRKFLADRLLSEGQPITYGTLSASLDVHVNRAKGMLFDFHQYQNGLHGNTVYATYLVCGIVAVTSGTSDEEEANGPSQQPDDLSHVIHSKKLTLVGEEKLRDVLGHYKSVTSIHVYGLSPNTMKDFSFCKDPVQTEGDQATEGGKQSGASGKHGAVRNLHVRLQDRKLQSASAPSSHVQTLKQAPEQNTHDPKRPLESLSQLKKQHNSQKKEKEVANKLSTSDRAAPSSILNSFAKATANVTVNPRQQAKEADKSAAALSDDGEADDSDILPSKSASVLHSNTTSRKDREDALRRMMEEEEEEEEEAEEHDGPEKSEDDLDMEDNPVPEANLKTEADPENIPATQTRKEPSEIISSTGDGRRRGKRQVLKKKRILDDQGYMVTIQESGWESFSEDESIQPPTKKATPAPIQVSSSAKTKKTSVKGSQGSIMSFFAKK